MKEVIEEIFEDFFLKEGFKYDDENLREMLKSSAKNRLIDFVGNIFAIRLDVSFVEKLKTIDELENYIGELWKPGYSKFLKSFAGIED